MCECAFSLEFLIALFFFSSNFCFSLLGAGRVKHSNFPWQLRRCLIMKAGVRSWRIWGICNNGLCLVILIDNNGLEEQVNR